MTKAAAVYHDIGTIVAEIISRFKPWRIILFGSYAYSEPHEDSDLDLLVVIEDVPPYRGAQQLIQELRPLTSLPLQIVFLEEFEESKNVVGGLAYPAHHWGRVLYAQDA